MPTTPDMLTIAEVCRMCRVSEFTIRRLWALDEFPQPVKLGSKNLWRRGDILRRLGYPESTTETIEMEVDNHDNTLTESNG